MDSRQAPLTNSAEIKTFSADQAKAAVRAVGPRVYTLTGQPEQQSEFFIMGCQGDGGQSQKEVAALMNSVADRQENNPAFVLVLGDNVYDYGVDSPSHTDFDKYFHGIYANESLTRLRQIPFFVLLGNHDSNQHTKKDISWYKIPVGEDTSINEVAHSYMPEASQFTTIDSKIRLYQQPNLTLQELPQWNMPYFYYSLIIGNTQIFCLDSNSYAKEFLSLQDGSTASDKPNQAEWFKTEFEKARQNNRKIILAMHHPIYTSGKRSLPNEHDSIHYLTSDEINKLNTILHGDPEKDFTSSYNMLLNEILQRQQIEPDMVYAAHDHFMSYYNNKANENATRKICQITAGGGGGKLQERCSVLDYSAVACHLKNHGFAKISMNHAAFNIDFYSTAGHHLRYSSDSHEPIRTPSTDSKLEDLRQQILAACELFFAELSKFELENRTVEKPNTSYRVTNILKFGLYKAKQMLFYDHHRQNEILCADQLRAYLNQSELPDLSVVIAEIQRLTSIDKLPNRSLPDSFYVKHLQPVLSTFGIVDEQQNTTTSRPPSPTDG